METGLEAVKKRITKEDGRYLIYYHFPHSAEPEQSTAFEKVEAAPELLSEQRAAPEAKPDV